jgi:hypothetical protein
VPDASSPALPNPSGRGGGDDANVARGNIADELDEMGERFDGDDLTGAT